MSDSPGNTGTGNTMANWNLGNTENGNKLSVIVNRSPVTLSGKATYVFVDVFFFIDFDLKASNGRSIVTLLNGRTAEYMEPLSNGDVIEIYWEDEKKK